MDHRLRQQRIPEHIKRKAITLYVNGEGTGREIAAKFGCCEANISTWVRSAGKPLRSETKNGIHILPLAPVYDRNRVMVCGLTIPDAARALYRAGFRVVGGQCNWRVEREQIA